MARLSKNERIRQHKKVHGKSFTIETTRDDEPILINVRVTKLIRKGQNDCMFVTCFGMYQHRNSMFDYSEKPFKFWARVAFTHFGPAYYVKGGSNHISTPEIGKEIVRGCENILLEITILGGSNEQDTETGTSESAQTTTEAE